MREKDKKKRENDWKNEKKTECEREKREDKMSNERGKERCSHLQNVEEESNGYDDSDKERVCEADDDDGAENGQQVVHKTTQNHWQSHLWNIF
jgi:hypothetical protein